MILRGGLYNPSVILLLYCYTNASSQLSIMIKYINRIYNKCDMCSKEGCQHMYLDDKHTAQGLFPEVDWRDLSICENCAKREVGSKHWKTIKRNI